MKMNIHLLLSLSWILAGFLTIGAAEEQISVKTIINKIQDVLVQAENGLTTEQLQELAEDIAENVDSFLDNKGVHVADSEVRTLLTETAGELHNFAGLTALFDDALSLEAAKLDSAFFLLRQLSTKLSNNGADSHNEEVVLAAIGELSLAIADTASETNDIATYLYNNSDNNGDDEDDNDNEDDDDDDDNANQEAVSHPSRRGFGFRIKAPRIRITRPRVKLSNLHDAVKGITKGVTNTVKAATGVVQDTYDNAKKAFHKLVKNANFDDIVDRLKSEIHSDMTVFVCTRKCKALSAKFNLGLTSLACRPVCDEALKQLEDRIG